MSYIDFCSVVCCFVVCFFKQKTAYEVRISDWSSDVCSSDLIPSGWACFSACNFVFMGGQPRLIDPGGVFMVHMFTRTGDRSAIDMSVALGTDATKELIGDIEQDAALLRSEEHTSELQSLMRISYAVFCLNKKKSTNQMTAQYTKQ